MRVIYYTHRYEICYQHLKTRVSMEIMRILQRNST